MAKKILADLTQTLKPLFVNSFTKEFTRSFMDRDEYLELKLSEICSGCPLDRNSEYNDTSVLDSKVIDDCRMEYFGQLLQSFVGRSGDDETRKLFSYFKKCEECLSANMHKNDELQKSGSRIQD